MWILWNGKLNYTIHSISIVIDKQLKIDGNSSNKSEWVTIWIGFENNWSSCHSVLLHVIWFHSIQRGTFIQNAVVRMALIQEWRLRFIVSFGNCHERGRRGSYCSEIECHFILIRNKRIKMLGRTEHPSRDSPNSSENSNQFKSLTRFLWESWNEIKFQVLLLFARIHLTNFIFVWYDDMCSYFHLEIFFQMENYVLYVHTLLKKKMKWRKKNKRKFS